VRAALASATAAARSSSGDGAARLHARPSSCDGAVPTISSRRFVLALSIQRILAAEARLRRRDVLQLERDNGAVASSGENSAHGAILCCLSYRLQAESSQLSNSCRAPRCVGWEAERRNRSAWQLHCYPRPRAALSLTPGVPECCGPVTQFS